MAAAFDDAHGGYAGDARTLALTMTELGRSLAVEPYLACAAMAGHVLAHDAGADPFALSLTEARAHGSGAADVHLRDLPLGQPALLKFSTPAQTVLDEALDRGLLGLRAETAGMVRAANAATFSYLVARKQFGVPLASVNSAVTSGELVAQRLIRNYVQ